MPDAICDLPGVRSLWSGGCTILLVGVVVGMVVGFVVMGWVIVSPCGG